MTEEIWSEEKANRRVLRALEESPPDKLTSVFVHLLTRWKVEGIMEESSADPFLFWGRRSPEGEFAFGVSREPVTPLTLQAFLHRRRADRHLFCTTKEFTPEAREFGEAFRMELLSGDGFGEMVRTNDADGELLFQRDDHLVQSPQAQEIPSLAFAEEALQEAQRLLDQGDRTGALRRVEEVLTAKPTLVEALALREAALHPEDPIEEIPREEEPAASPAPAESPRLEVVPHSLLLEALSLFEANRYSETVEMVDRYLTSHPEDPEAARLKVLALQAIEPATKETPWQVEGAEHVPAAAAKNKISLLYEVGRFEEALTVLNPLLKLDRSWDLLYLQGLCLLGLKNGSGALEALEAARLLNPKERSLPEYIEQARRLAEEEVEE